MRLNQTGQACQCLQIVRCLQRGSGYGEAQVGKVDDNRKLRTWAGERLKAMPFESALAIWALPVEDWKGRSSGACDAAARKAEIACKEIRSSSQPGSSQSAGY